MDLVEGRWIHGVPDELVGWFSMRSPCWLILANGLGKGNAPLEKATLPYSVVPPN